jgi:hypothetical protein
MRMGFQDVSSFYVPPATPGVGLVYTLQHVSPSCHGAITFTPVAGEDYEAAFVWEGKTCLLSVNQVLQKDGKVELKPVRVVRAADCE